MTHWFVVESGPHAGKPHLQGWMETAIKGADGWLSYAICPRCHAMVPVSGTYGDQTWAHEQWHAATDFPIPKEVRDRVTTPPAPEDSLEERVRELEQESRSRFEYEREMNDRGE